MEEEKIHLYIREKETGRIVTHFLFPLKDWKVLESLAVFRNISMDDLFKEIIDEAIEKHSAS